MGDEDTPGVLARHGLGSFRRLRSGLTERVEEPLPVGVDDETDPEPGRLSEKVNSIPRAALLQTHRAATDDSRRVVPPHAVSRFSPSRA